MKIIKKLYRLLALVLPYKSNALDDIIDSLNYRVTSTLLLILGFGFLLRIYLIPSFHCHIVTHVGGFRLKEFVDSYCFLEGTIPIGLEESIPQNIKDWNALDYNRKITYYQWLPLIPFLQAFIMFAPYALWKVLLSMFDRNMSDLLHVGRPKNSELDIDSEHVQKIYRALKDLLFSEKSPKKSFNKYLKAIVHYIKNPASLFFQTLLLKVVYVFIAIGQVYLLNDFFISQSEYNKQFGWSAIKVILSKISWTESNLFPRVGFCYVPIKHLVNNNLVIAQCSLRVNMLTELYYVSLWFIFNSLFSVNLLSVTKVVIGRLVQQSSSDFIGQFLKINKVTSNSAFLKWKIRKFEKRIIKRNGLFLINILLRNAGPITTSEIVMLLWDEYKPKYDKHKYALPIFKLSKTPKNCKHDI